MFCAPHPRACTCSAFKQHTASAHPHSCQVQAKSVSNSFAFRHRTSKLSARQVGVGDRRAESHQRMMDTEIQVTLQARLCTLCTASSSHSCHASTVDRLVSGLMACAAAASISLTLPAHSAFAGELQPFLSSTGIVLAAFGIRMKGDVVTCTWHLMLVQHSITFFIL